MSTSARGLVSVFLLGAFAIPPVAMLAFDGLPVAVSLSLTFTPFLAMVAVLAVLARRVGSSPDDPDHLRDRLAASLGLSREEYEEREP